MRALKTLQSCRRAGEHDEGPDVRQERRHATAPGTLRRNEADVRLRSVMTVMVEREVKLRQRRQHPARHRCHGRDTVARPSPPGRFTPRHGRWPVGTAAQDAADSQQVRQEPPHVQRAGPALHHESAGGAGDRGRRRRGAAARVRGAGAPRLVPVLRSSREEFSARGRHRRGRRDAGRRLRRDRRQRAGDRRHDRRARPHARRLHRRFGTGRCSCSAAMRSGMSGPDMVFDGSA